MSSPFEFLTPQWLYFTQLVAFLVILWFCYLWFLNSTLKKAELQKSFDCANRIVSLTHGLCMVFLGGIDLFLHKTDIDRKNTSYQNVTIIFSASYFVYDNLMCLFFIRPHDIDTYVHHSLALLAIMTAYPMHGAGAIIWGAWTGELSNFYMHLRKILENEGLRHTKAFEIAEMLYFAIYIVARSTSTPIIIVSCLMARNVPPIIPVCACLLMAQSLYYMKIMLKLIRKKFE